MTTRRRRRTRDEIEADARRELPILIALLVIALIVIPLIFGHY